MDRQIEGIIYYSIAVYLLIIVFICIGSRTSDDDSISISKLEWLWVIFAPITLPFTVAYIILKGMAN